MRCHWLEVSLSYPTDNISSEANIIDLELMMRPAFTLFITITQLYDMIPKAQRNPHGKLF